MWWGFFFFSCSAHSYLLTDRDAKRTMWLQEHGHAMPGSVVKAGLGHERSQVQCIPGSVVKDGVGSVNNSWYFDNVFPIIAYSYASCSSSSIQNKKVEWVYWLLFLHLLSDGATYILQSLPLHVYGQKMFQLKSRPLFRSSANFGLCSITICRCIHFQFLSNKL